MGYAFSELLMGYDRTADYQGATATQVGLATG